VPTKNQPEFAIAALQSEQAGRIASMLPPVAAPIEAAVDSQAPPRCSHFAQKSLGSSRRPRPAVAHLRVRLSVTATYTVGLVPIQSDICDIAYSAGHPSMRLCAAHPAHHSTLYMLRDESPITEQTSDPDDRHGAGDLMVTLATRSTAAGPVTMGSRQHSPTDTNGS
jgi:hypothetical protein